MSGQRASVWTPRHTTKLFPGRKPKHTFQPEIIAGPYVPPPPPPSHKKPPPVKERGPPAEELIDIGKTWRAEAAELEKKGSEGDKPTLGIQLGLLLLTKDDFIKRVLKDWDSKGKGEFLKAEFRLNLRNVGLNPSSAEADSLFDSWDEDGGGSLDLKELKEALLKAQAAAKKYKQRTSGNPNSEKVQALIRRAQLAEAAAEVTAAAERLEEEHETMSRRLQESVDVRLGGLLSRRRIKPGAVVTSWAKGKGNACARVCMRAAQLSCHSSA